MAKISIKGVVIGGISDVLLTSILGIPLSFYAMSQIDLSTTPKDQVMALTLEFIHSSVSLHILQILIGLGCSVLGGYISALLAKRDEILNGLLASWFCMALSIYSIILSPADSLSLEHILLFISSPAFAALGGYLRLIKQRARVSLG